MSDDVSSVFWNPAGLGFVDSFKIAVPYGRYAEDIDNTEESLQEFQNSIDSTQLENIVEEYQSQNMIISGDNNIGIIVAMPGFGLSFLERDYASVQPIWTKSSGDELDREDPASSKLAFSGLRTYKYSVSACYGHIQKGYFFGITSHYIEYRSYFRTREIITYPDADVNSLIDDAFHGPHVSGSLWSFDLGLLLFMEEGKLGIVAKDINKPKFELPDERSVSFDPQYRIGLAVPISPGIFFDIDYDLSANKLFDSDQKEQLLALGMEMQFFDGKYQLSVGGNKNIKETGSPYHYTFGTGFEIGYFGLEAGASYNPSDNIWNWSAMAIVMF